jgi:uncharacterized protein with HEPN domain
MRRDLRKYLGDILQCIDEIEVAVNGISFETYRAEFKIHRAVERDFTIIAEALSQIGQTLPDVASRVDHLRGISGFRNVIIHDYFYVDNAKVWSVVHDELPLLKEQVEQWKSEVDGHAP